MPNCPNCNNPMDEWYSVRFNGTGSWKGKEWPCKKCGLLKDGTKPKEIKYEPKLMVCIDEPSGRRSY